jgi:hypothetical protein
MASGYDIVKKGLERLADQRVEGGLLTATHVNLNVLFNHLKD